MTRLSPRRTNSPVANCSICVRSMAAALNAQSKSSRFLSSWNLASRIRRSTARWRLRVAGSPKINPRKPRCDRPSCSARDIAASSISAEIGALRVARSCKTRSRRLAARLAVVVFRAGSVFFFGVVMIFRLLKQQVLVVGGGTQGRRIAAKQLFPRARFFVRHAFQEALRSRLHRQDAFHGIRREGAVTHGPFQGG